MNFYHGHKQETRHSTSIFECVGEEKGKNSTLYKCLFEGCKVKTRKDGTPKYLSVKNDSRYNDKRHYLVKSILIFMVD